MNTHKVLKRIPGTNVEVGSEVDASEWRNATLLVDQRYLKPLDGVIEPASQQSEVSFDERVIAAVKRDIERNGELAQVLRVSSQTSTRTRQSTNKS